MSKCCLLSTENQKQTVSRLRSSRVDLFSGRVLLVKYTLVELVAQLVGVSALGFILSPLPIFADVTSQVRDQAFLITLIITIYLVRYLHSFSRSTYRSIAHGDGQNKRTH